MSFHFDKVDVRRHLADLGYNNVDEEKLDDFVKDLRRLVKYEEKKKRIQEQVGVLHRGRRRHRSASSSLSSSAYGSSTSLADQEERVGGSAGVKKIVSENIRLAPQTPVVDTVDGRRRKLLHFRKGTAIVMDRSKDEVSSQSEMSSSSSTSPEVLLRITRSPSRRRSQSAGRSIFNRVPAKPTTSFIRPPRKDQLLPKRDLRCDPVKLHQFYQRIWNKTRFPGDGSDKDVRWAVRERMMGNLE